MNKNIINNLDKHIFGKLISIEGVDGSGKSSLARGLYDVLSLKNKVILTREPGGSRLGQYLRKLLQEKEVDLFAKAELFLFFADRAQHFEEKIIPAMKDNNIIISDRLSDSSLAYQGYARGLDKDFIKLANNWIMDSYCPDITVYLKVDYQTAISRILKRGEGLTSFEKENSEFFKKVINGFNDIFEKKIIQDKSNSIIVIDGTKSQQEILKEVVKYLNGHLKI